MSGLNCEGCRAPLVVPNDYTITVVNCQYCGRERLLPDAAQRMEYMERLRDDAAREAEANARAREAEAEARAAVIHGVGRTASNVGRVIVWIAIGVPALLGMGITGIVTAISNSNKPASSSSDPPPASMLAVIGKAQSDGCARVITANKEWYHWYKTSYDITPPGCVEFVAASDPPSLLTLTITDPKSKLTSRSATGTLEARICGKDNGNYKLYLSGAQDKLWVEALSCTRKFSDDPTTNGKTRVGSKLKELMSHGCFDVSLAATTFYDERRLTTPLNAGQCMQVIAASGIPDNDITVELSTPFGESVKPMPSPGTDLAVGYCAASAGPHITELSAALSGPYSIAVAICNRSAMPKNLPKASK